MIWFALIVLLLLADSSKGWTRAVIALGMVALVFLHFWVIGAIP